MTEISTWPLGEIAMFRDRFDQRLKVKGRRHLGPRKSPTIGMTSSGFRDDRASAMTDRLDDDNPVIRKRAAEGAPAATLAESISCARPPP